jgi:hypothetical protein
MLVGCPYAVQRFRGVGSKASSNVPGRPSDGTPGPNLLDLAYIQKVLDSEYAPITENPSFRDLVVLSG